MAFRIVPEDEQKELQKYFESSEKHILFYQSIKFKLENVFPYTTCDIYSFEKNNSKYFYAHKHNKLLSRHGGLVTCVGNFNEADFIEGFMLYESILKIQTLTEGYLIIAFEKYTMAISKYYNRINFKGELGPNPTYLFYMTEEQEDEVLKWKAPLLPDGLQLGYANPELDARLITSTWVYAREEEIPQTRAKLECFPSSVIRHNGTPVAYEMMDHFGYLNHQYTHEEYRCKGYGKIVELDISQKCLKRGFRVFKCVEPCKPAVLASSKRSKIWTVSKDEAGEDEPLIFFVISQKQ